MGPVAVGVRVACLNGELAKMSSPTNLSVSPPQASPPIITPLSGNRIMRHSGETHRRSARLAINMDA